ncbi:rhomboid family intramembrane serine protease [Alkaliphilus crotonatoxidans]
MIKKINYNSPVILTYTIISFISLLLGYWTQLGTTRLFFSVYRSSPVDPLFYLRLLGHAVGHINFEHFLSNFMIILIIGPMLEEKYGSKKLLFMMLITAVVTGLINILLFPTALLGASGVVFMFIVLSSYTNQLKGRIPLTLVIVILFFIGREIYSAILINDNISRLTHIVGGVLGMAFGYGLSNRTKGEFSPNYR